MHSYTNREMADLLEISERMYSYYEKGEYDGNPAKVKKYLLKLSGKLHDKKESETPAPDLQAKYIKLLEERLELELEKGRRRDEEIHQLKEKLSKKAI
jgi:hypothetical protein